MKDSALVCMAGLVVLAYAIYIFGSVAAKREPGDGMVFGGVLTAIGILAGVKYERQRIQKRLIK